MLRLLHAEWLKLKSYRAFWICALLYMVSLPGLIMSLHTFNIKLGGGTSIGFSFYHFPVVWHNITFIAGWFNLLLYFFFILLITNEFQFRTLRQHIIDGLSREQVVLSKGLLVLIFSTLSTLLVGVLGLVCGYLLSDTPPADSALVTQKLAFLGAFWLQNTAYLSFAAFLSLIIQKQGFTILFFLIYGIVLENLLRFRFLPELAAQYLPLRNFGELLPSIFNNLLDQPGPDGPATQVVVVSLGYILLLWGGSWAWLKTRDL